MAIRSLPQEGSIFLDPRGGGRALRVSWHHESGLVVLSLWRDHLCSGSFRVPVEAVPDLIDALRAGLDAAYDVATGERHSGETMPVRVADGHAEAG